jgi:ATP-dependent helicase HepA
MIEKFVLIDNKEIGKINSVNEDKTVDVEIFFNISNIVVKNFNMNQLKYIELSNQTRTYYKKDDKWSIGRIIDKDVLDNGSIDYEVQFPNKEKKWISEKLLHVRSLKNLLDPTDVLAFSYGETQYLHDARMKILNWIINLRESVSGLTALSSSSIELVVHQINVAKKILSDPIQRYLLSDEVGMGKTIESGIIARQCLLDDNLSTVLVIVPKHLKKKWEMELFSKF